MYFLYFFTAVFFIIPCNGKTNHSILQQCPKLQSRLPSTIVPDLYKLFLRSDVISGTFTGTVDIAFNLTAPMDCLPFHSNDLIITYSALSDSNGGVPLKSIYQVKKYTYWVLQPEKQLEPGVYHAYFNFSGNGLNRMNGFYRSSYRAPGEDFDRYLMTTKFEPADARLAFPCFDEPLFKAKFLISVGKPNNFTALSNSHAIREVPGPNENETTVEFGETPKMSTYLVAAVISDFKELGSITANSAENETIPLRVYSAPHLVKYTDYARKVGKQALAFFVDYFKIPYPLPKLDMISIPDFVSGAMENWGLITFKVNRILTPINTGENDVFVDVAHVIAHEMSHQWFGNLVTMKWWDDIWLNEGFARFMEYKGVAALNQSMLGVPLMLDESKNMAMVKMSVMEKDAMSNSHPIVTEVSRLEDIAALFDPISYSKGGSILMMIEQTIGEDVFRSGVQKYLANHTYGNAASSDLWEALGREADLNLASTMQTWTHQMGFPLVTVERTKKGIQLTQQRYKANIYSKPDLRASKFGYRWDIPICYESSNADDGSVVWFQRKQKRLTIAAPLDSLWVKINCHGVGYYRVNYDLNTWNSFADLLWENHTFIDAADRVNLLDDAFALAQSGYLKFTVPLRLSAYLSKETNIFPLAVGFSKLNRLKSRMSSKSPITQFVRTLVKDIYKTMFYKQTWDFSKRQLTSKKERYVLELACKSGLSKCRQPVIKYFRKWIENKTEIDPEIRHLVYKSGMKYAGTSKDWEILLRRYKETSDPQEKPRILSALFGLKNGTLLRRLLEESFYYDFVRPQDFFMILQRVGSVVPDVGWQWYQQHYSEMVDKFSLSHKGLGQALFAITSNFNTQSQIKMVNNFFKQYPDAGAAALLRKKSIEKIQNNMKWRYRTKEVNKFFNPKSKRSNSKGKRMQKRKKSNKKQTKTYL